MTTLPQDQRSPARRPALFHVVLHEPEIPNNTGNIGRTCVAAACSLHLIHPLGFDVSAKACRRAGLDYWPRLDVRHYSAWDDYRARSDHQRLWLFTTKSPRPVFDVDLEPGDALVFGKETSGLPPALVDVHADRLVGLPMLPDERSLNLATAVCAVVYEGIRQLLARRQVSLDPSGRLSLAP